MREKDGRDACHRVAALQPCRQHLQQGCPMTAKYRGRSPRSINKSACCCDHSRTGDYRFETDAGEVVPVTVCESCQTLLRVIHNCPVHTFSLPLYRPYEQVGKYRQLLLFPAHTK
jgi:hypothetical protein